MIFTPDILHLGMEFWKTLLQVCAWVISNSYSCFSSIKRFLLNFINLVLYFGVSLISGCFIWVAGVCSLNWKLSGLMPTLAEKISLLPSGQIFLYLFSGLFPEVFQLKWKASIVLNEYCSRSSYPLLLVSVFIFVLQLSCPLVSWHLLWIFMPMNNNNSASCVFGDRKTYLFSAYSFDIPLSGCDGGCYRMMLFA